MNRLTKRLNDGKELCIDVCEEKCVDGHTWCPKCKPFTDVMKKLAEYEDLEEKLEKVYGECDGLLEIAINSLIRHEGAEIGTPAKARLLTDEDVDEWESYKAAKEQGLLLRLPCKAGSTLYKLYKKLTRSSIQGAFKDDYRCYCEGFRCDSLYEWAIYQYKADVKDIVLIMDKIGKTIFLTKEEAEIALARMEKENG